MVRLIPAHAGKTSTQSCTRALSAAHPRSRGENIGFSQLPIDKQGSSPLTRGKLQSANYYLQRIGLIPAHAGKTMSSFPSGLPAAAHPRSRGENFTSRTRSVCGTGSSPLTRGKHFDRSDKPNGDRLIPAHAGKTNKCGACLFRTPAHPRSRGENTNQWGVLAYDAGSSPLTRGKRSL